jgi:hypothetical protein
MDIKSEENVDYIHKRQLHLLTTDILLTDLISGGHISCNDLQTFNLDNVEARKILNWYKNNRPKWANNLQAQDCEAMIDALGSELPPQSSQQSYNQPTNKRLRLAKLTAHRFAGLHAYGSTDNQPAHFVFEPEKPITLFEGWNGSGKTSIANAMIWCLTGQLLRAQRSPEAADQEFSCHIDRADGTISELFISPVTPLPNPEITGKHVPADTWVELIFIDDEGNLTPPFRRTQSRKSNGKLIETTSDENLLGLEPISFHLGTTMPGMLPFLQIGATSELGTAVARLTGLADLVDLSKHASKAEVRINGAILSDRRNELAELDQQFNQAREDLEQRIIDFPSMAPKSSLPLATENDSAQKITELKNHFQTLKADGLVAAKEILGESFDAENQKNREDLESHIEPALEQIKRSSNLQSIERLAALKLNSTEVTEARRFIFQIQEEAKTLAELTSNTTLAKRTQLYARISTWMEDHNENNMHNCVVCRNPIKNLTDPETGILIKDHLEQIRKNNQLISKTVSDWATNWTGILSRDLPFALRNELNRDLPKSPARLIYNAWADDLFNTDSFKGTLSALQSSVTALAKKELSVLPKFSEPDTAPLPQIIQQSSTNLSIMLKRIERAIAFGEWTNVNKDLINEAVNSIRRGRLDDAINESIGSKLDALNLLVKGVAPITAAITLSERMSNRLEARNKKNDRIKSCIATANSLHSITPLGDLAQAQVDHLRSLLHTRTEFWRDQIYQNATSFSPKLQKTGMNAKGVINIHVGRDGVHAPAQHVSNASALRASLFGFYLAFREHVLDTTGGLKLLILDDPQDLLDHHNRQRLARAITKLANDGAQILTTSHDHNFARTLVSEARSGDLITHCSVHPVNASRSTVEISLAIEDLDRKRLAFINNIDSASHAQDYANEARIFLEARLGDLFDDPAYPAYSTITKAPTLIPLFERLRGLVSAKSNELFRSTILSAFCIDPGMQAGAEARRILNQSHHDKASISYADVERIDVDLRRLRSNMEQVHEEFRRYRWREPMAQESINNVISLQATATQHFNIPVCQDIAAFTGHLPEIGSQDNTDEWFDNRWFDNKALFYIRHNTLGFSAPAGSVVIVEVDSSLGRDHSLIIARKGKQIYARRLVKSKNAGVMSLCAEATDPRTSRPTLSFDEQGIETHKIVGVLFDDFPLPEGREEAAQIEGTSIMSKIEVAYRVREESAVPLALPNQLVLGGKALTAADLTNMEGQLIAVTINDGTSILKRVGARLPGLLSHFRQFETVGGLGDSIVIATEQIEEYQKIPYMLYARPILGVIYEF